jgi:threonine/homoserine efflux transporter RhtA
LHLGLDCVFAVGIFLFSMQRYSTNLNFYLSLSKLPLGLN